LAWTKKILREFSSRLIDYMVAVNMMGRELGWQYAERLWKCIEEVSLPKVNWAKGQSLLSSYPCSILISPLPTLRQVNVVILLLQINAN